MIRLIATDLDGTLLEPDGTLPEGLKFTQEKPDEAAPLPVGAALDAALANRPDLKNFREQLRVSEYQLYSRYSAFSPRISAFANYSYSSNSTRNSGNNPNGFANFYVEGNSFNYGAMAELTIFNGLIRYNRLRESGAQLAIMQYKGAEAWLRIVADVRNAHANVQHNRELAALNRENRDIMREQRDLVAKSYLAGEAEITRLNEAQNNFVAAEEEYVQSLVNLSKARAQLAAAGHPLLGDGKYGRERENKKFGRTGGQALYSYKLAFHFTTDAGCLSNLNGKVWTVEQVDFVDQYFPGTTIS